MNENKDIFDKIFLFPVLRIFHPFYQKHKEVLLYLFFGALTTIVSIGSFVLFDTVFKFNVLIANIISWILAVSFAYVTNRKWVFNSKSSGKKILEEAALFFSGRISTLIIEEIILLIFITLLKFNGTFVKISAQFVVLLLNYIISKIVIFKEKKK